MTERPIWETEEFWQQIAPDLHICAPDPDLARPALCFDEAGWQRLDALLDREGYLQLPPADFAVPVSRMAAAITRLHELQVPAICAYVFDEFWQIFQSLAPLLSRVLGADYRMQYAIWAWYIDAKAGESGWPPHRDKGYNSLDPDGKTRALTVWVPLTEATPLNSCMYLVPKNRDPQYGVEGTTTPQFGLTDIRALPAAPGSVLCWTQAVLHWGGHTVDWAANPRISLSIEFQRADVPPLSAGMPVLDPNVLPSFRERLRMIGFELLHYQHIHPLTPQWLALAERLRQAALV
jgi:hypothetical protein